MLATRIFSVISAVICVTVAAPTTTEQLTDTTDYSNLTAALVRAAPPGFPSPLLNKNYTGVSFDLNGTVEYGIKLIEEAAANGANLIVFPELWFPGYFNPHIPKPMCVSVPTNWFDQNNRYPKGNDDAWIEEHVADYIDNSLEIGSAQWNNLLAAAKDNSIYISLGFSEKTNTSIYMGLAIISKYGELLHHRQKLRPSGGERNIWSDGTIDGIKAIDTPYGRWGVLECWE